MNTNAPLNDPSGSEDNSILLIFVKGKDENSDKRGKESTHGMTKAIADR